MRHGYTPEKILIEKEVDNTSITRNVLSRLPQIPTERIDSIQELLAYSRRQSPSIASAKKWLVLARHRGEVFKPCPAGTTKAGVDNLCCDYYTINMASNCHMECSYCYLQEHLNFPFLILYADLENLLDKLDGTLSQHPKKRFRIGTGELADSLGLDPIAGYTKPLVEFFAKKSNAWLELKTKTDCVDGLLDLCHKGHTVVSWSMNTRHIQGTEEHKTATIDERLQAARRCSDSGYPVAFHFDPLVDYPGALNDYVELVQEIFQTFNQKSIAWVSVGALRMTPGLLKLVRKRFPKSPLPLGELTEGFDGRLRYFKPIRLELMQVVLDTIRSVSPQTPLYACMEDRSSWSRLFPNAPSSAGAVGDSILNVLQ